MIVKLKGIKMSFFDYNWMNCQSSGGMNLSDYKRLLPNNDMEFNPSKKGIERL